MVMGLLLLFFGYRLFRFVISLVGFIVFAFLTFTICMHIHVPQTDGTRMLYLGLTLGAGVMGAIFFSCFYHIGVYFVGGLGGLALGMWIQSLGPGGVLIQSEWGKALMLLLLALLGMLLIHRFERTIVIISTSLAGAYLCILGLDFFLNTGFTDAAARIILTEKLSSGVRHDWATIAMKVAVIVLAAVGSLFQSRAMDNPTYIPYGAKERV